MPVCEREEHPDHQIGGDRAEDGFPVDLAAKYQVTDDAGRGAQVEQTAHHGHHASIGDLVGEDEVQDHRERREDGERTGDHLEAATRLGGSKDHPDRRDLHGDDDGHLGLQNATEIAYVSRMRSSTRP